MGKLKKKSKSSDSSSWGQEQHQARMSRKMMKLGNEQEAASEEADKSRSKRKRGYERSIHLSHDSYEKKQESKLRLHISKTKRELEALRRRLTKWDEREEQVAYGKRIEEEERKRRLEEEGPKTTEKKRRKRLGPETWKLRGAARPAYEVYDFDTRYVCPHLKAHKEASEKASRVINAFHCCKGYFGKAVKEGEEEKDGDKKVSELLVQTCRTFLSVSVQSALLNMEAKKFKSARDNFLEIIELEGPSSMNPITNARCRLMRMYIEANRPDSARRLWERLPSNYPSVWIRYSAALLEFVSWKILEEDGSTRESAKMLLDDAIRSNIFCAYYIAFHETFEKVMEYTDDVEDAEDGTLEQAIEYCTSEQMGSWIGTEGATEWIKGAIVEALNGTSEKNGTNLSAEDVEWEKKVADIELIHENASEEENEEDEDEENTEPDELMFAGMFRVGMDMLSDAGELISIKE
jgi:hypothetical protein